MISIIPFGENTVVLQAISNLTQGNGAFLTINNVSSCTLFVFKNMDNT